ncbi:hypothetical protein GURKE_04520 [Brevundimonas phage vB_BpoS-Gurke]|uniref:Uncharacterized protein n=1 Tax=Brevundimonas phage vB_BpoS-Gurke TaxID=2948599 RepID=A0A9E7N503_9CAUD|nr:hypothetical protein GURKE_04520 [Brevundimonas phage vB_BpoS-Gurke]
MQMVASHYEVLQSLLTAQQAGALATRFHYVLNAAFRKANMKGAQIRTMDDLKANTSPADFAAIERAVQAEMAEAA